jgi:hypothetical protein
LSVEGQVLGAAVVAGGTGGAVASLMDTGNSVLYGAGVALAIIIVAGIVARKTSRKS